MFVIKMYRVILVKLLAALENTAQVKRRRVGIPQ